MKYCKRPIIVDAIQWFRGSKPFAGTVVKDRNGKDLYVHIETKEGAMSASNGDWIVKGIAGEFYPVKPDIFEAEYEWLR